MKKRFKIIPAVYLVLFQDDKNKILLLKRQNTGFKDGEYSLPSGHVEGFETPESMTTAMIREAKEEIGVDIKPEDLKLLHVMNRFSNDGERIDFFFTTDSWQGTINNMEPEKCSELEWFDLNNLPNETVDYIKDTIEKIRNGILYSEYDL